MTTTTTTDALIACVYLAAALRVMFRAAWQATETERTTK